MYGGSLTDSFTTYEVGSAETKNISKTYLNLELTSPMSTGYNIKDSRRHFGRIIFHTEDVDELYSYLKNNVDLSKTILFEDEPRDAPCSMSRSFIWLPNETRRFEFQPRIDSTNSSIAEE